jgi:hypothetical protein
MENENFQLLDNLIAFLIKILGLNTVLKDGYRELHIIPRVMDVFKFAC